LSILFVEFDDFQGSFQQYFQFFCHTTAIFLSLRALFVQKVTKIQANPSSQTDTIKKMQLSSVQCSRRQIYCTKKAQKKKQGKLDRKITQIANRFLPAFGRLY